MGITKEYNREWLGFGTLLRELAAKSDDSCTLIRFIEFPAPHDDVCPMEAKFKTLERSETDYKLNGDHELHHESLLDGDIMAVWSRFGAKSGRVTAYFVH